MPLVRQSTHHHFHPVHHLHCHHLQGQSLCKFTEFSFSIIQSFVHHSLQNVKLPYNAFCHKIYYVGETLCAACLSRVVLEEISQLFNHRVIAQCVITCNTQTLGKADEYLVYIEGSLLTLPEMLNLSNI